jgi:hypothetical protein
LRNGAPPWPPPHAGKGHGGGEARVKQNYNWAGYLKLQRPQGGWKNFLINDECLLTLLIVT